jgi:hypothetical protein
MALKAVIKWKNLSVAVVLDIVKKVDNQLHVTRIKLEEELDGPVSTMNNIMTKQNHIQEQRGSSQASRSNNF